MELKTYLILQDLTGKPVKEDEFRERLTRFNRSAVIRLCSILNLVLSQWSGSYDIVAHNKLVHSLFPGPVAKKIVASGRPALHRHQLLFVIQEAIRYCDEEARDISGPYWNGFGVVLLMASEILYRPLPKGATLSEDWARKISLLLPDMEANKSASYVNKMARSLAMCGRFLEPFRNSNLFFDVGELFEAANGFSLDAFHGLMFGLIAKFTKLDEIKKSSNPTDYAVSENWLRSTTLPASQIKAFFDYVSSDSASYREVLDVQKPQPNDFTLLRNKPLFFHEAHFYPVDLSLLAEKFESGIFWSANSRLIGAQRETFHSFWGTVFEAYLTWLFEKSTAGKANGFFPRPRYAGQPDEEVCDAIILSGRCAVFVEYKGSTFTSKGKYGADPKVLDAELKVKLVGTPNRRKGVFQLVDAVEKLCRRENPEAVEGVDMYGVTTIFPLIITRDDLGSAFNVNAYLNNHFQEGTKNCKFLRSVTPLFCMSADDIEGLSPFLRDTRFSDILAARYRADKSLTRPFWTVPNMVLNRKGQRTPELLSEEMERLVTIASDVLGLKEG
jgi:hypothetical protein